MSRIKGRDVLWVGALCTTLLLVLLPYYSYTAMLLPIQQEWGTSSAEAGLVFGATQVGYVAAVVLLMPLTDRIRTSYVVLGSSVLSVLGNALFAVLADGVVSGAILRAVGGAGVAGTYMPGMRLISERFSGERRGGPIGIYVASFVMGGAVSFGGAGAFASRLGWRGTYLAMSLAGIGAVALAVLLVRAERSAPRPAVLSHRERASLQSVLVSRPVLLMTVGYTAHVWELYGMRSWTAPFLATILMRTGSDLMSATAQAAFVSSVMIVLGAVATGFSGGVSDRLGRTATAAGILLVSAACSLVVGWLVAAPYWLVVAVCLLYGLWVNPDSPVFSTGVTEVSPPERLGTAMAFQSVSGWTAGILAPVAFGLVLDLVPGDAAWGVGFTSLGVGAMVGVVAMAALRRSPQSALLAGGRR